MKHFIYEIFAIYGILKVEFRSLGPWKINSKEDKGGGGVQINLKAREE